MDMVQRPTTAWPPWLEMAGLTGLQPAGSLRFSHYDQLITAATQGHGIAIGSTPLVAKLVREGKLVTPFSQRLASPRAYHVVVAPSAKSREEVQQLVAWLVQQALAPESKVSPP
jgi:DNA-binding transcriptional LysR family regulator